jgi:signal peptidase II
MIPLAYWLAAIIFAVDQLSKYAIIHLLRLPEAESIALLPVFSLTWVENRGVSMGMLTAGSEIERWLLVAVTGLIAVVVAFWAWRSRALVENIALGLVFGGALGNILDRVRLGYVVDFVHLHLGRWSFYVFNVADAAITTGVVILLLLALTGRSDGKPERLTDA